MDGLKKVTALDYNPRCLHRDLTSATTTKWMTYENLYNVTIGDASKTIKTFQEEIQGRFGDGFLGLHSAGHYAIGGDDSDLWTSVVDPAFMLHHAMLDRVWWQWQALHPKQAATISGTLTMLNSPPSRDATLDDDLDVGVLGPKRKNRDLMSTISGTPRCYIYD